MLGTGPSLACSVDIERRSIGHNYLKQNEYINPFITTFSNIEFQVSKKQANKQKEAYEQSNNNKTETQLRN